VKKLCILLIVALFAQTTFAADEGRTGRRFGLMVDFNGDPAPSAGGFNLGLNVLPFMRIQAGVGGYSNGIAQVGADAGYGMAHVGQGVQDGLNHLVSGLSYLVTLGLVKYSAIRRFWGWNPERKPQRKVVPRASAVTYGGGAKFFLPVAFSPSVGVNIAHIKTNGSVYGVDGQKTHVYYNAGIDWQTSGGFHLGLGWNICPSLRPGACGFNGSLGAFF
jgi:hypothetical protein